MSYWVDKGLLLILQLLKQQLVSQQYQQQLLMLLLLLLLLVYCSYSLYIMDWSVQLALKQLHESLMAATVFALLAIPLQHWQPVPPVCCNHPPPTIFNSFLLGCSATSLFSPSILVYSLCSCPSWRGKTFPQLSKSPYPIASPISPFFLPVFHYHPLFYSSSHSYSSFTSFRLVSTTRPSFLFDFSFFSFLPPLNRSLAQPGIA